MHDDDVMDRLLREAMAADAPRLSPGFDDRVLRRVRPRRLTPLGRAAMIAYAVAAAVATAWLMRDLPPEAIGAAIAIGVPVAAGATAYTRRIVGAG